MKRLISVTLIICMLFSSIFYVSASAEDDDIKVEINGNYMTFENALKPILVNGGIQVPFRETFEALGYTVGWDDETEIASATRGDTTVKLPVGNELAKINDRTIFLDQPAMVMQGEPMVPLQFIIESLIAKVEWDEEVSTVRITADIRQDFLFLKSSYSELGTWGTEAPRTGSFSEGALKGGTNSNPANTRPAIANFRVYSTGQYRLWVHSMDFPQDRPGIRFFSVAINGIDSGKHYGTHCQAGYAWQDGGVFTLHAGENLLEVIDSADFYARCDGILLVQDQTYVPSTPVEVLNYVQPYVYKPPVKEKFFPFYPKEQALAQATIENGNTKVVFYTVQTPEGTVIQNEILSKRNNDECAVTKKHSEDFGYLLINADMAKSAAPFETAHAFNTAFNVSGEAASYYGTNIYKAGVVSWLIPDEVTVEGNKAILKGENEYAYFCATWTLESDNKNPLVSLNVTYKIPGAYSVVVFEGDELPASGIEKAYVPGVVDRKEVPEDPGIVIPEKNSTEGQAYYTAVRDGIRINKGVAIEEASLPNMWGGNNNSVVGIGLRGLDNNYRAALFAPVLGSAQSNKDIGASTEIKYRVISEFVGLTGGESEQAATPAALPAGGTYTASQSVTLTTATEGANIYYTLDGSKPTTASALYVNPIDVNTSMVIKAIAVKEGMNNSTIAAFSYEINIGSGTIGGDQSGRSTEAEVSITVLSDGKALISKPVGVVNGFLVSDLSSRELDKAFEKAILASDGIKTVVIEIKESNNINKYVQKLPAEKVSLGNANNIIQLITPAAELLIPSNMFRQTDAGDSKVIELVVEPVKKEQLDEGIQKMIGSKPVINLYTTVDGKKVEWSNPSAPIEISIKYSPTAEELENPDRMVVYYIDGNNNLIIIPSGRYDEKSGKVTFITTHFSSYAIGYSDKTFNDISKVKWASDAITLLAVKGVAEGTSKEEFSPGMAITRGESLAWLIRTLGLDAEVSDNFDDTADSNYSREISIAKALNIVKGVGDNKFAPDENITRQDLMIIIEKALDVTGKGLEKGTVEELAKFKDASKVSKYALESVAAMIKGGLITGTTDNNINPKGNTTRAEAAVIMCKLYKSSN